MGREVHRVPLDFAFPLNETWTGYLMPDTLHETACPDCKYDPQDRWATGLSPAANAIAQTFYPHQIASAGAWPGAGAHAEALAWCDKIGQAEVDMLVSEKRLRSLVKREPTPDNPRDWEWISIPRTAAEVNEANRSAARRVGPRNSELSHDGINRSLLIRFRCQVLGIEMSCTTCDGHGSLEAYPGQRADAEAWERTDPPKGEGWQLWQTVSEGGPISPVFETPEGLAEWMASPAYTWGASKYSTLPYENALAFVKAGWAPSFAASPQTGVISGEEWVGSQED